jgi:hypothetical protein
VWSAKMQPELQKAAVASTGSGGSADTGPDCSSAGSGGGGQKSEMTFFVTGVNVSFLRGFLVARGRFSGSLSVHRSSSVTGDRSPW